MSTFIYPPTPAASGGATAANQTTEIALLTQLELRLAGALVPENYDEIALTYVVAGNGIGEIATSTYKLASVTIKTLTLSYDASNRLSNVLAS